MIYPLLNAGTTNFGQLNPALLFGLIILAFCLMLIFSKDLVWSLFETFYSILGIEAQRGPYWDQSQERAGRLQSHGKHD